MIVKINKIKNTCIYFNSILYTPVESKNMMDYYEIPCELNKKYEMKIIHYSGTNSQGIGAVISRTGKSIYNDILKEMKSLDIDLYYCQIDTAITIHKSNATIIINTEKIESSDIIGKSSFCRLKIVQNKNTKLEDCKLKYYPSNLVKVYVYLIETILSILGFFAYSVVLIIAGDYSIERWNNPASNVGPYPFFLVIIPMAIISIVLIILELNRVAKNTLKLENMQLKQ